MRRFLLLFIIASPLLIKAQSPSQQKQETDSVKHYQREIDQLSASIDDSLIRSHVYDSLTKAIKNLRKISNNYSGPAFYGDIVHTDFGGFNNTLVQNGFAPMNDISGRIGFGWSAKNNRIILDLYIFTASFNTKSTTDSETIKLSLSNFLQFDLGYDLLNSKTISIYPYAGISVRSSEMKFSSTADPDSGFSHITNIVSGHHNTYAVSTRIGFQAGIGFDYTVATSKDQLMKTILFTTIGVNRPIGEDKYEIEGTDYTPGIKQADWLVTVGVKFGYKR
jgi:hypothetical protein